MSARGSWIARFAAVAVGIGCAACAVAPGDGAAPVDGGAIDGGRGVRELDAPRGAGRCAGHDPMLWVPEGFCARVIASGLGPAAHVTATAAGDVLIAVEGAAGRIVSMRGARGEAWDVVGFGGPARAIVWHDEWLYAATGERVVRWALPAGKRVPDGEAQTIVGGLPADAVRAIAIDGDGALRVSLGASSEACADGRDPCPELAARAGVWVFDRERAEQGPGDGRRVVTGVRAGAIAIDWRTRQLAIAGDGVILVGDGADRGWPYCVHDAAADRMVLAPAYGGDGVIAGRCAAIAPPVVALPAEAAPAALVFYRGRVFPEPFRSGAFVALRGGPGDVDEAGGAAGDAIGFVPAPEGQLGGVWSPFVTGFAGDGAPSPDAAVSRPAGIAVTPDGALIVTGDRVGRVWRVTYE